MDEMISSNENNNRREAVFFPVATKKFVIMSIVTFGFYELYWFYKNWQFVKEKDNSTIKPFWRAWFAIFFCHQLFKEMKDYADAKSIEATINPASLTSLYILLFITHKLPDPFWILSVFTFVPLLMSQKEIMKLNENKANSVINDEYSRWNIVGIVVGSLLWAVAIFGMIVPA